LPSLERLIRQRSYFVIHAPRQTGKTTAMLALAEEITEKGQYCAVTLSVEVGNAFNSDIGAAELAILDTWRDTIAIRLPADLQPPDWGYGSPGQRIRSSLQVWAQNCLRPIVLFIDEIDYERKRSIDFCFATIARRLYQSGGCCTIKIYVNICISIHYTAYTQVHQFSSQGLSSDIISGAFINITVALIELEKLYLKALSIIVKILNLIKSCFAWLTQ
jgi:hypothetical protein